MQPLLLQVTQDCKGKKVLEILLERKILMVSRILNDDDVVVTVCRTNVDKEE